MSSSDSVGCSFHRGYGSSGHPTHRKRSKGKSHTDTEVSAGENVGTAYSGSSQWQNPSGAKSENFYKAKRISNNAPQAPSLVGKIVSVVADILRLTGCSPKTRALRMEKYSVALKQYREAVKETRLKALIKTSVKSKNNELLTLLGKLNESLEESTNVNDRARYRAYVRALRAVITSEGYKRIKEKEANRPKTSEGYKRIKEKEANRPKELSSWEKKCLDTIRTLVLARWARTTMYDYHEDILKHTLDYPKEKASTEDPPTRSEELIALNKQVKKAPASLKKSFWAVQKQKLTGHFGIVDFGQANIPFARSKFIYANKSGKTKKILLLRHGTPHLAGSPSKVFPSLISRFLTSKWPKWRIRTGASIAPDYEEFLEAAAVRKKDVFVCLHQKKLPTVSGNEADRVESLLELQKKHTNLHILVQPANGKLFDRKGKYRDVKTFKGLKDLLLDEFCGDTPPEGRAALPEGCNGKAFRTSYRGERMSKILDNVHKMHFGEEPEIASDKEWKAFINLFYSYQRTDFALNIFPKTKYLSTLCKDFLDRGGAQALVHEQLHDWGLGKMNHRKTWEERKVHTLATSVAVKGIEVIERHLKGAADAIDILTKRPYNEEEFEQYRDKNHERSDEGWYPTGVEVPRGGLIPS